MRSFMLMFLSLAVVAVIADNADAGVFRKKSKRSSYSYRCSGGSCSTSSSSSCSNGSCSTSVTSSKSSCANGQCSKTSKTAEESSEATKTPEVTQTQLIEFFQTLAKTAEEALPGQESAQN